MGDRNYRGIIEAVLFSSGEPVSASRIAEVLETELKQTKKILNELIEEYAERKSGISILKLGDQYQMASNKEFANEVRSALDMRRSQPLSQASMEVLAIIAYNQPVTRAFMEQIRGVDCSGVVSTLCEKELIEEAGRLDLPGRPIAFKTTANFLRAFSLSSLDELPALPKGANAQELATPLEEAMLLAEKANEGGEN